MYVFDRNCNILERICYDDSYLAFVFDISSTKQDLDFNYGFLS